MKSIPVIPQHTDLLLVGGGHSHLAVIKHFAMQPVAGLRLTVISKDIHTPYSGMMPGMIAGHYHHGQAHIDLQRLCQLAGARLYHSKVTHIDVDKQQVFCQNRASVRYDYLSINTGSQPAIASISGANQYGISVKPIDNFLNYWQKIITDVSTSKTPENISIAIVGGGAASIEVALACRYRLDQIVAKTRRPQISLYCGTQTLLPSHNRRVARHLLKHLNERDIALLLNKKVIAVKEHQQHYQLTFADQNQHQSQHIIWAVHASAPAWLQQTGLSCDDDGFIKVNHYLQSCSHNNVFSAGDVAHFSPRPLAKSGVYAVRAGQVLAVNLRRAISGKALQKYRPQRHFLSLLMTGSKHAIASKGNFSIAGNWVWRWKNRIDRRFMAMYQQPDIIQPSADNSNHEAMRCGGCGAKVNSNILNRVMTKLKLDQQSHPDVVIGLNSPDDAAVINPPAGKQWLQTVDYFRAFIDDPYLLGQIASNHCLSDIYAMGGTPHSALAIATIPYATETIVEDTLLQLMSGAVNSLQQQQTSLIGGHTCEGAELGFGLSVNGIIDPEHLLTKGKLSTGQRLIITKPLGSGILLAANMQGQAQGRWLDNAIKHMLISNQQAAAIMYQYQASACTDITGFGLLGHLAEMLKAGQCSAELELQPLPILIGAIDCASRGFLSSLHPDNEENQTPLLTNAVNVNQQAKYPLLFDPQTSGGLLAAVDADKAELCLQALRSNDCPQAAIVGTIIHSKASAVSVTII